MITQEKINKLVQIVNHPDYYTSTTREYRVQMLNQTAKLGLQLLREIKQKRNNEDQGNS